MRTSCSATTNERLPRRQPSPAAAGNERSHGYGYERPYWRNWRADRCPCGGNGVGGGVPCASWPYRRAGPRRRGCVRGVYRREARDRGLASRALAVEWAPEHDFEVARDENIAFIMCGSIYTPAVFCRDYLAILHRILTTMRVPEKWAYATSVEPVSPRRRVSDQFVLLNGVVYVLSARISFDFLRCFSRTKADAEKEGIWWLDDP